MKDLHSLLGQLTFVLEGCFSTATVGAPNSGQGGWYEVDTPVPWKRVGVSSHPAPTPRGVSSIASQEYNNLVSECLPNLLRKRRGSQVADSRKKGDGMRKG